MHQHAGHQRRHEKHVARTTEPGHEQSDNHRKVFHARVKCMIGGEIDGTKVVREQGRQGLHWDKKFRQQRFHPLQFGCSSINGMILSLSGRTSNSVLLCGTPGDWFSTNENEKSTYRDTIMSVTNLVHI